MSAGSSYLTILSRARNWRLSCANLRLKANRPSILAGCEVIRTPPASGALTIGSTIERVKLRAKRIGFSKKIPIIPPSNSRSSAVTSGSGQSESATDIAQLANAVATRFRGHGSVRTTSSTNSSDEYCSRPAIHIPHSAILHPSSLYLLCRPFLLHNSYFFLSFARVRVMLTPISRRSTASKPNH